MANMRLCTLFFGLVILGISSGDNEVDLTCNELNMAAVFDADQLTGKILEISVTGCNADQYKVDGAKVSVAFKDCAKTITEDDKQITQENEVAVVSGWQNSAKGVERLVVNYFTLQCKFDRNLQLSSAVAVNVADKRETFADSKVTEFAAGMSIYQSSAFEATASSPFEVIAYTPIHMQVKGLHNNELFKFVAVNCFATATGDANDATKYLFFMDKCKLDDSFVVHSSSTPNTFSFSIQAFTFIKLKKQVYFHCSLLVCKKGSSGKECTQKCDDPSLARRKRAISYDALGSGGLENVMVRSGPIRWKSRRSVIA